MTGALLPTHDSETCHCPWWYPRTGTRIKVCTMPTSHVREALAVVHRVLSELEDWQTENQATWGEREDHLIEELNRRGLTDEDMHGEYYDS